MLIALTLKIYLIVLIAINALNAKVCLSLLKIVKNVNLAANVLYVNNVKIVTYVKCALTV